MLNRREAIRSIGRSVGAAALTVSCAPTEALASTRIGEAIDTHRRLAVARDAAFWEESRIIGAFNREDNANPVSYETSAGRLFLGLEEEKVDVSGKFTPVAIQETRSARMQAARTREHLQDSQRVYEADLAARAAAQAENDRRWEACGGQAAEDVSNASIDAESEAWAAFLSCAVSSHSEASAKAGYILENEGLIDRIENGKGQIAELLLSITSGRG